MKALYYTGPNQMVYREAEVRSPPDGELLVRVEAAGICGSDMHAYHGQDARRVPPLILGHEVAGTIVSGPGAGQKVALNPLIICGECSYCLAGRGNLCPGRTMLGMSRPGAMAQEVTIPQAYALPLPIGMSPTAAALMEPAGCAWHAIDLVARAAREPISEAKVLVIGAGAIGLLTALLLRSQGCHQIELSDTNPLRRATAAQEEVGPVHDPREKRFTAAFDIVFDAVGTVSSRETALNGVKDGGVIMHVGLGEPAGSFNARRLTLAEISFLGSYAYTMRDLENSLHALQAGTLGDLAWVETRSLADGAQAFADLDAGRTAAAKIVLLP